MPLLSFASDAGRYVRVPQNLHTVTHIDDGAECDPRDVGMSAKGVAAIWNATEQLYRSAVHPAITLVVRRRGQIVIKRAIGAVRGNLIGDDEPLVPLTTDTPICLFSASKVISALLVHKLVDQGRLSLDDYVAAHLPEFAAHGKGAVTVRQLLAHRAGIPAIPMAQPSVELLRDWDNIVALLCAAKPISQRFQRQAYHALTSGFIIGDLVRRVSGRELPELMQEWIAAPLGCTHLTYGVAPALRAQVPDNIGTGRKPFWPITKFIENIVGVPFEQAVAASNTDIFLSSVVPAGNIYASADDVSRVFQMLLNGGEFNGVRVFKSETVADAIRPFGNIQFDGTMLMPIRFSAGFMLGESPVGLFGPMTRSAFGHLGFISVLGWADPKRDISVALLNNGKTFSPIGMARWAQLINSIACHCD